jgi:hypothetical protein
MAQNSTVSIVSGYNLGWLRGQSSSLEKDKIVFFSMSSKSVLGLIQPPIQQLLVANSLRVRWLGSEADHSPPTSTGEKKYMELCINYPICHQGIVLNQPSFSL